MVYNIVLQIKHIFNCLLSLMNCLLITGVMQATTMGGTKLEKRYSPSFRDEHPRKSSGSKRKRDDVLRLVFN